MYVILKGIHLITVCDFLCLDRYWALAVPTYVMIAIVLALGFYVGLNFMSTPSATSMNTMFGEHQILFAEVC